MDLSRSLLKDFAKITNDPSAESSNNTYVRGTVKTVGTKKYVKVDGSEGLTPISEVVDVDDGDRVLVAIENHVATILGNFTFPPSARKEEEALNKAEDANTNANNANSNANNAVNKAESAGQKADSAIESAGQASQLAGQAVNKAEEAFTAADNANKNLEETKNLANDASSKADTALSQSAQAQSNVANAQTEINKIDKVVQGVKGDVNTALSDLNQLAEETTAIKQTMEVEYTKKTDLSVVEATLKSEISKSAGELKTEISETYASKSYVDSIKTGSTNLALGTSSKWSDWITPPASSSNSCHKGAVAHLPIDQKIGDKYTSQIEIEFSGVKAGTGAGSFRFMGNGGCKETTDSTQVDYLEVVWGSELLLLNSPPKDSIYKLTHTYAITESTKKYHVIDLGFRADNWDGVGKYRYRCIKVEKGDKAGDWTPAPTEMATNDALVEIEGKLQSQITQNASGLSSTVSKVEKLESNTEEAQKLVTEALSNAFDAQAAADQAQRSAAEAKKKADEATANSVVANEKAAEAKKLADAARQQVEIADRQLAEARTTLQEAKQNLDNLIANGGTPEEIAAAQQRVDEATTAVDQALADVAEAENTAQKAQEAADKAKENADEAQLIADNAKKKADNAKIVADQALQAAELAAQRVAELTKRIDQAETAIRQNADNIELTASKTTEIGDTLKNNYYNKKETDAAIKVSSDNINLKVNKVEETSKATANDLANYIETTDRELAGLQNQIDGSIMTWFYGYVPTGSNRPAVEWNTVELKNNHLGDLFYDTVTGYCYRWQVQQNQYSWNRITDVDVTKALSDAAAAQDTADSKRRVFVNTPYPPYDIGDLWVQGSTGDIMRCVTPKTSSQSYISSDWTKASKYTDDTTANGVKNDLANNYYDKTETKTQIDLSADSITQSVRKTYTTKDEFNNLEIGGRNLLLDSGVPVMNSNYLTNSYIMSEQMIEGQKYSCTIWGELGSGKSNFYVYLDGSAISLARLTNNNDGTHSATFLGKTGTLPKSQINIYAFENSVTANSTITKIKMEKGNKATDWSPAPEDINGAIRSDSPPDDKTKLWLDTSVDPNLLKQWDGHDWMVINDPTEEIQYLRKELLSSITETSDKIKTEVSEKYYEKGETDTIVSEMGTRLEQTKNDFNFIFEEVQQSLNSLSNSTNAEIQKISKYIRFVDGNIVLGQVGNELTLKIQHDRISFTQNNMEVAYFSNRKLYVTDGEYTNSLTLGNFAFTPRANGNLSFRKVR